MYYHSFITHGHCLGLYAASGSQSMAAAAYAAASSSLAYFGLSAQQAPPAAIPPPVLLSAGVTPADVTPAGVTSADVTPRLGDFLCGAPCARAGCQCVSYNGEVGYYCCHTCRGTPTSPGKACRHALVPGDIVLSVNGISGLSNFQVVEMLRKGAGEFNLVVISGRQVQDHINTAR